MSEERPDEGSEPVPPGWGDDALSHYVAASYNNCLANFVHRKDEYANLLEIERHFRTVIDQCGTSDDGFTVVFLMRCHAAFLGSCKLAMAGAVSDTPILLRGCLENALYGLHVHQHPETFDTWCRRPRDRAAKKAARDEFRISRVMKTLEAADPRIAGPARILYERTIDSGAHPNVDAFGASLNVTVTDEYYRLDLACLTDAPLPLLVGLKMTADVGICALLILGSAYPDIFARLGIPEALRGLATRVVVLARQKLGKIDNTGASSGPPPPSASSRSPEP